MSFSGLLSKMVTLFLFICIGFFASKVKIIDEDGSKVLNRVVFNFCAPCMALYSVMDSQLSYTLGEIGMLLVYALSFNVLLLAIGWLGSRILCRKPEQRGAFNMVSSFGNIAFMGFPVISALYGNSAIFLVSICTLPFNFFLFGIGPMLALGGKKTKLPLKKIFLSPTLLATVAAFLIFFFHISFPAPVEDAVGYLGNMVVPLSMILIGASLGRMKPREVFFIPGYYFVCLCKLIVMPLVLSLVFRFFVKDPLFYGIFVVLASMPSATMAPVICAEYGGDSVFSNSCVFITTLFSMLTVPAMLYLLLL